MGHVALCSSPQASGGGHLPVPMWPCAMVCTLVVLVQPRAVAAEAEGFGVGVAALPDGGAWWRQLSDQDYAEPPPLLPEPPVDAADEGAMTAAAAGEAHERAVSVARSASAVVRGMVSGFLLEDGAGSSDSSTTAGCASGPLVTKADDVMEASVHTVSLLSQLLQPGAAQGPVVNVSASRSGGTSNITASVTDAVAGPLRVVDTPLAASAGLPDADDDGDWPNGSGCLRSVREGLVRLISLECDLADQCTDGRSLDTLRLADRHLRNVTYVGGRLAANGADVHDDLQNALVAFEGGDLQSFGVGIGRAWRAVLLSDMPAVPRNDSVQEAIAETSKSLIQSFFAPDSPLPSTDSKDAGDQAHVDIQMCLQEENMDFFAEVWDATSLFFTQLSAAKSVPQSSSVAGGDEGITPNCSAGDVAIWQRELSAALVDLPATLRRCGMEETQEKSLLEAVHALGELNFQLDRQSKEVRSDEFSVNLADAISYWEQRQWASFGDCMGRMLHDLVVLVAPRSQAGMSQKFLASGGPLPYGPFRSKRSPYQRLLAAAGAAALCGALLALAWRSSRQSLDKARSLPANAQGSALMYESADEALE